MRQINANITIPSLTVEEIVLNYSLKMRRLVHEGAKTQTPSCCPQRQRLDPPLGSLTRW